MIRFLLLLCPFALFAQADSPATDSLWQSQLLEVVISGQQRPVPLDSSIRSVRIITAEEIDRRAVNNMEELLRRELGFRSRQDGVLGGQISLQGLGGEQVQIMIDGVPVIGRNGGNIDLSRLDLQAVERIEIVEGPMSVNYGNNALAGSINIITKKAPQQKWEGSVEAQGEQLDLWRVQGQAAYRHKGSSLRAGYRRLDFAGFSQDTLRSQPWNPKRQQSVFANLSQNIKGLLLHYRFAQFWERVDDLGIERLAEFPEWAYARDYRFYTQSQDHQLALNGELGKGFYLQNTLAFNDYRRQKQAWMLGLMENDMQDSIDRLDSDSTRFLAGQWRASLSKTLHKNWEVQLGWDMRSERMQGGRVQPEPGAFAEISDYALFGQVQWQPFKALQVEGAWRATYNNRYRAVPTFSLSALWKFEQYWSLRGSYARGFRAPSLKELYLDFIDASHHIKGNPQLEAERSHHAQVEVAYQRNYSKERRVELRWRQFYNYLSNQIALYDYVLDSLGNMQLSPEPSFEYAYFNRDQFQTLGSDLRLDYRHGPLQLRLGARLTGQYNEWAEQKQFLAPFSYTFDLTQEILYDWKDWQFSLFRMDVDRIIRYTGQENPQTGELRVVENIVQGYALVDVRAARDLGEHCQIALGVKNLLGVSDVAQAGQNGAHSGGGSMPVAMGRRFFLQLRVNW